MGYDYTLTLTVTTLNTILVELTWIIKEYERRNEPSLQAQLDALYQARDELQHAIRKDTSA